MLLALLSDTHDNAATTRAALALLAPHKPAAYLHAGDLVAPEMLELFAGLPFYFVFGNNEFDLPALRSRAHALNLTCLESFGDLAIANDALASFTPKSPPEAVRIALLHGHEHSRLDRALRSGHYRYLIHGHTHQTRDETVSFAGPPTRIINPGALQRTRTKSVALLNTNSDELCFFSL